ncbi:hypothetical protein OP10G_1214 [Fimbriimonas ginsengisoli Gsoil 348]|uniref:Uncharacterized protein n=2 Tax=Fimbriimonas ginsengisoli TaxID=1005039 RepID=A0A068NMI4_FIMGI|nr:hypothetical protein OP10G_1214 [Fimbriimonas ginsengisoli Gsoil 348]
MGVNEVRQGARVVLGGRFTHWIINPAPGFPTIAVEGTVAPNTLYVALDGGNFNLGTHLLTHSILGDADELATGIFKSGQWNVVPYESIPQPPVVPKVEVTASVGAIVLRDNRFTIGPGDPQKTDPIYLFQRVEWSNGFSFCNLATNMFLGYAGDKQPLKPYPMMCVEALWQKCYCDGPGYWCAYRPWSSPNMVLTVAGGGRPPFGSDVIVDNWTGQHDNNMWAMF